MIGSSMTKALKPVLKILLLPFTFVAKVAEAWFSGTLPRWAYLAIEITTVAVVTVVLAAVNWYFGLERYLIGPLPLRKVWLGLLAFLGYASVRLILLLLQHAPRRAEEFPDIAEAVASGCEALAIARINIRETPLFLIVGTEDESDSALASSPVLGETFFGAREAAPVRWHGNHEAIWVTIPGVSAISAQISRVTEFNESEDQPPAGIRLTVEEKELHARRLKYFMTLIRKIRGSVVPLNGVLLAVPYRWISDPEYAQLADTVQSDMSQIQGEAKVKCQCHVVFHDMEETVEFAAYLDRISATDQRRLIGCSLPFFTSPSESDVVPLHDWLQTFFERSVFGCYQQQLGHETNALLYRLLNTSRQAQQRFRSLLTKAFAVDARQRFYLGGVYFASFARSDRALFDGIPERLLKDHDEVIGWNELAIRRDRRYRLWSSVAAAAVVIMLALDVVTLSGMIIGR